MTDVSLNTSTGDYEAQLGDYFALLKPRVMSLVVFTALVGLFAAPVPVHPVIAFSSILFIAIGAGASGALNMWWDADIDVVMRRTAKRPIPAGRVTPEEALGFGLGLSVLSVMMLALFANLLAAALLATREPDLKRRLAPHIGFVFDVGPPVRHGVAIAFGCDVDGGQHPLAGLNIPALFLRNRQSGRFPQGQLFFVGPGVVPPADEGRLIAFDPLQGGLDCLALYLGGVLGRANDDKIIVHDVFSSNTVTICHKFIFQSTRVY